MKKILTLLSVVLLFQGTGAFAQGYVPTPENLKAREEFSSKRLGIFIHWGVYSMFGQGEWYLQTGALNGQEYSKAVKGFYPANFDAAQWVGAFLDAGAGYVTFTSRHHDGFSMFKTEASDYNIVDATPYGKDICKQLADECHRQGLALHFYYSTLDWYREDYPLGESGRNTGRDESKADYDSYLAFMETQVKELLTNYAPVRALWFDGVWDHKRDLVPFDWRMPEFYRFIHSVDPACLIGNNHHITPFEGEDFQMFERDLPGENTAGYSEGQQVSHLPLEMCQTMNHSWGYRVSDLDYKSTGDLIRLLVRSASKNSNMLINIGPQPDGSLPDAALERLKGIGEWMRTYSPTIDGTTSTSIPEQPWGVTTRKDGELFIHVLDPGTLPLNGTSRRLVVALPDDLPVAVVKGKKTSRVKSVTVFADSTPLKYNLGPDGFLTIDLPAEVCGPDFVISVR